MVWKLLGTGGLQGSTGPVEPPQWAYPGPGFCV